MKSKILSQRSFKIFISVDEEILREQRGELNEPFSLKEAIQNEFGWLHESGIYLKEIYSNRRQ